MNEINLKQVLNERIQIIFKEIDIISKQEYPMESIVMFLDELGLEELPNFVRSDDEYIIEFVVEDIKLSNQTDPEIILMNFIEMDSKKSLGLALIKDHQLVSVLKEGNEQWTH